MSPSERVTSLLSSATRAWAAGPRPRQERKVANQGWKTAIGRGLLGLALAGTSLGALASPPGATNTAPAASHAQAGMELIAPQFVATAIDKRAGELPWVLPTGQIDGGKLLHQWRKGGVTPEQATQLLNVMVMTQSPVVAQTSQVLERTRRQVERTAGILDVQTGEQAAAFLETTSTQALVWEGLLHSSEALNALSGEGMSWADVEAYWHRLSPDRSDEANSEARTTGWGIDPTQQDMRRARVALLKAVQDSGLAGLRVPFPAWNDSINVLAVAKRVEESNALLQDLTGWKGPVLGLNGRVEWTVHNPLHLGITFYRGPDQTVLLSGWEDLPHEWFHALDYALRDAPVNLDLPGGATLTQQWSERAQAHHDHGDAKHAWGTLHNRLRAFSLEREDSWFRNRDLRIQALRASHDEDDQWRAGYLDQAYETTAFVWQAFVQTHLNPNSASWTEQATNGRMGPMEQEARATAPFWSQLFEQVGQQWWGQQYRSVNQWRADRTGSDPAQVASPPAPSP